MKQQRGLGRGLDALFGEEGGGDNVVINIPLAHIDPSGDQPRKRFDQEALDALAASIASVGVIQPIIVQRNGPRYGIIAGERRWRAARIAGLAEIPALVRDADKLRRMEMALIENLQRADLNPVEEAAAVRALIDECGLTQEAVAQRVGKSRPAVANLVRLLDLPDEVLDMLRDGLLTPGHARALVPLPVEEQLHYARYAVEHNLNVRAMEEAMRARKRPSAKRTQAPPPELQTFAELARRALGVRVSVRGNLKRGQLVVPYSSAAELQRLYDVVAGLADEGDEQS